MPVSITFNDVPGISGSLTFSTLDLARATLDAIAGCLPATAPDLLPVEGVRGRVAPQDMQPGEVALCERGVYKFRVACAGGILDLDHGDSGFFEDVTTCSERSDVYTHLGRIDASQVVPRPSGVSQARFEDDLAATLWPQVKALAEREGVDLSYLTDDGDED